MHELYKCSFNFFGNVCRQISFFVNFFTIDFEFHIFDTNICSLCIIGNRFQHIRVVRVFEQLPGNIRIVS